jgi:hypothetical protein
MIQIFNVLFCFHPSIPCLPPSVKGISIFASRQCRKAPDDVISLIKQFSSFANSDRKLYILVADRNRRFLGFVKVGVRNLVLWDPKGAQHKKKILCLLDFFTSLNYQRKGQGKRMVDAMLENQQLQAPFAMERPTSAELGVHQYDLLLLLFAFISILSEGGDF